MIRLKLLLPALFFVAACSEHLTRIEPPAKPLIEPTLSTAYPQSFLRVAYPEQSILNQKISAINLQQVALQTAVESAVPNISLIPLDANVNLALPVSIKAHNISLELFLQQLTGLTDYHFSVSANSINVSSLETKKWNVAALSARKTGRATVGQSIAATEGNKSQGNATFQTLSFDEDYWQSLIASAKQIAQVVDAADSGADAMEQAMHNMAAGSFAQSAKKEEEQDVIKPYIVHSRVNGMIMAAASPSRIKRLDEWIMNQIEKSTQQFYLDINAYEVVLRDSRGSGIDWNYLKKGNLAKDVKQTIGIKSPAATALSDSNDVFSIGAKIKGKDYEADALFKFLQRYGTVSLLTQPNITITNGKEAYFSSGLEFSYTSSITQSQDQQGNVTVTPKIDRVKVGVSISITARLLHNNKIALDVVPVITAVEGFESIRTGNFTAKTPNIALKEMATQVITEPGVPVRLGGLISEKLQESATRIPRTGKKSALLDVLFKSQLNKLERRELVISITPSIIS